MNEIFFLKGENYILRPLTIEDVQGNYKNWLNDPEVNSYNTHARFPRTENYLVDYVNSLNNLNNIIVLAIVDPLENNKHIGNISLQSINWIDRSSEIAFILGEKTYWGKGVMFECGKLLIEHAFKTLNLNRIACGTSSLNVGMQKLAIKLGMSQEGIRKNAIFKNGIYADIIEYGILNNQ
jgi:ribosomal-protein-alanine N-acetyltransferase